jgi:catechol 2,3-dioxygenase-like lactoylglutathione lyase family enzyme
MKLTSILEAALYAPNLDEAEAFFTKLLEREPYHREGGRYVCFQIEEDQTEAWKSRLAELGIPIEVEHTWPNGTKSLYFRDPAGNSIELAPWRIWNRYD